MVPAGYVNSGQLVTEGVANHCCLFQAGKPILLAPPIGLSAWTEAPFASGLAGTFFGVCGWLATSYYPTTRLSGGMLLPVSAFKVLTVGSDPPPEGPMLCGIDGLTA